MEFAKKFALIPHDQVNKHIPMEKDISDLDNQMSKILKSSLSEYEKVQKYYEILQKKMNLGNFNSPWKSEMQQLPVDEELPSKKIKQESPMYDDVLILDSVPQNMRKYASNLLVMLKNHPDSIKWNDRGEMLFRGKL